MAPQTKVGRAVFAIALGLAPVAGVIGAIFGMTSSRLGKLRQVYIFGAPTATFVAAAFAFAISYQLWPHRPWAQDRPARKAEAQMDWSQFGWMVLAGVLGAWAGMWISRLRRRRKRTLDHQDKTKEGR